MDKDVMDKEAFQPAWWCRGSHAQTIWGAVGRPGRALPLRRQRWELPDGDFLDADVLPCRAGAPVLVIFHGLESSSRSSHVMELLRTGSRRRWGGVAVNFRSCGGTINRLRRLYHGGDTQEIAWILGKVAAEYPGSPIVCAGFSLGGNTLLKYLGEQGSQAPDALRAAVAISAPFDLEVSVRVIEQGFSRAYGMRLVQQLTRKARAKLARFPDLVDPQALNSVRTVAEFDELVTAPVHGFPSAAAYWASSSCGPLLPRIARPTLLINALDDPFFPAHALPREAVAQNACLAAEFPSTGGHMGFVSGGWPGWGRAWAADRAVRFLDRQLAA